MEQYLDKPTPKGRLIRKTLGAVLLGSPQSLVSSLTEINQLLTGQASGDFEPGEENKQQFWRLLLKFVGEAHRGYGICVIRLGDDEHSKLQLLMMDRELSVTVTPDSDLKIKDKWDALE